MKHSVEQKNTYSGEIPNTPLMFLWYTSRPHKKWLFFLVLVVTIAAILGQSSSYFFKLIVDSAEAGNVQMVVWLGLAYPVTIFIVQTMFRLSGWLGQQYIPGVMKEASDTISDYILMHSHTYFADRFAGSILTKYSNIVGGIGNILPELFWTIYTGLLSFLVTFVLMLTIDTLMAAIFLGLVIFLIIFNRRLAFKRRELAREHAESRSALTGRAADVLTNVSAVRQYVSTNVELTGLRELTEDRRIKQARSWGYSEKIRFLNGIVMTVAMVAIFWLLITGWRDGSIGTGDLVLVLALVSQISHALLFIGQAFNSIAESFGEIEEGLDDVFIDYEITDQPNATDLQVDQGAVRLQAVTFAYQEEDIFKRLSVTIEPGQRVGLVGPSGAGKSTFVSLLLRQHDIQHGQIMIDEQNIAEVTQDSLRKNIALVPQEPMLFHRTIRENILYGKPDATDEEMIQAAIRAQAHEFIVTLPEGYDTLVGERGVKLSGGQKQRVAIARAMLKEAPLLVLDEATSALDSESEVAIQQALEVLMEGKTVLAVAHRLSTLRKMDRILVFENGKITEDGTHDQLAAADGMYAKLWQHQAGGFLQD